MRPPGFVRPASTTASPHPHWLLGSSHGQIIALNNAGWTREVLADSLTDLIEAATRALQSGNTRAIEFVLREG